MKVVVWMQNTKCFAVKKFTKKIFSVIQVELIGEILIGRTLFNGLDLVFLCFANNFFFSIVVASKCKTINHQLSSPKNLSRQREQNIGQLLAESFFCSTVYLYFSIKLCFKVYYKNIFLVRIKWLTVIDYFCNCEQLKVDGLFFLLEVKKRLCYKLS